MVVAGGARDLDLCLSCKGCASDCPTGVDMATWKSEVLHQTYRGKRRPISHYTLGRLPQWAALASRIPKVANAITKVPGVASVGLRLGGMDRRRNVPAFAPRTFRRWLADTAGQRARTGEPVLLFVDTFTDYFTPEAGMAAVEVLEAAGYRVRVTEKQQCCALTWITTGQLDEARKILGRTVTELFRAGTPIVGIEPSCTAVLRSDTVELLGSEPARVVADSTRTLAELLGDWEPPSLAGTTVVAQPHCHHHAIMGWDADAALLKRAGAEVTRLGGCCGLAGNFGVERGHYDVSVAVANNQLIPAVESADADTVVLADGYSCRTQLSDLTDREALTLRSCSLPGSHRFGRSNHQGLMSRRMGGTSVSVGILWRFWRECPTFIGPSIELLGCGLCIPPPAPDDPFHRIPEFAHVRDYTESATASLLFWSAQRWLRHSGGFAGLGSPVAEARIGG